MKFPQIRKTIDIRQLSHDINKTMSDKRSIKELAQDFLDLWEDHLRAQAQSTEAAKSHDQRKKD